MKLNPVLAHYIYVLRCCFYSSPKIKKLFERLYVGSLGRDKAYQRIWDLGKALTDQKLPLAASLFEKTSDAEVNEVIQAFLPLASSPSPQAVAAVASALDIEEFEPGTWLEAFDERGRSRGVKPLCDHSDYSVSLLFPLPSAVSEWKRRYPVLHWGCTPRRGARPSGIKGWAWETHVRAWEADFA